MEADVRLLGHFQKPASTASNSLTSLRWIGRIHSWDEWVPETRLLKFNEENLARQKQLNEAQRAKDRAEREALKAGNLDTSLSSKSSAKLTGGSNSAAAYANSGGNNMGARGTKRSRESMLEEEEFKNRPEIKLVIPDLLKVKLVDDWEAITKNSQVSKASSSDVLEASTASSLTLLDLNSPTIQLIPLPRTPSVSAVLEAYQNHVGPETSTSTSTRSQSLVIEVINGLKLYFNKCIGNNLLYKFERGQYAEMKKKYGNADGYGSPGKSMSDVYGVEHLLRLFGESPRFASQSLFLALRYGQIVFLAVNLPGLIAHTSMDAETVTVLRESLTDMLKFIVQEHEQFFNVQYEETSTAYQNVSRQ
jgi:hypothetical protein